MITDFFITLICGLVELLPGFTVNFSLYSVSAFINALNVANYYLPIQEIFVFASLVFGFYVFRLGFKIVLWLISRINIG